MSLLSSCYAVSGTLNCVALDRSTSPPPPREFEVDGLALGHPPPNPQKFRDNNSRRPG